MIKASRMLDALPGMRLRNQTVRRSVSARWMDRERGFDSRWDHQSFTQSRVSSLSAFANRVVLVRV